MKSQSNDSLLEQADERLARKYIKVSKELIDIVGTSEALFLENLRSKYKWVKQKGKLVEGTWFYRTLPAQQADTGLGHQTLQRAKQFFQDRGVLKIRRIGAPSKEYYHIDGQALLQLLEAGVELKTKSLASKRQSPELAKDKVLYCSNKNRGNNNILLSKDNREAVLPLPGNSANQSNPKTNEVPVMSMKSKISKSVKGNGSVPSGGEGRDWTKEDEIIQTWNALPGVSRVRLSGKPTKTLARTRALLYNLLSGKPLTRNVDGESVAKLQRFMDREKLDGSLYRRKWTPGEIIEVLKAVPDHPACADRPTLGQVLFNGFSKGQKNRGYSLFLVVAGQYEGSTEYRQRAERLAEVVHTVWEYSSTDREIAAWTADIHRFHTEHDVALSRIDSALAWYIKHSGDPYVPEIKDGRSFVDKFLKLEAAMRRADRPAAEANTPPRLRGMRESIRTYKGGVG